tara:strand:+ start:3862 stop:4029 length:168 start_codon:yes stop_codon:yes gene_type:complete
MFAGIPSCCSLSDTNEDQLAKDRGYAVVDITFAVENNLMMPYQPMIGTLTKMLAW